MKHLKTCVLTICLLLPSLAFAEGRAFFEDFEGTLNAAFISDDTNAHCTIVSASTDGLTGPYAGTKMMRCNYDGSGSNRFQDYAIHVTPFYNTKFFMRFKVRIDANVDKTDCGGGTGCNAFKLLRFFQTGPYHDLFVIAGHPQNAFNAQGNQNNTELIPTYWGGNSGDLTNTSNNGWREVEYYVDYGNGTSTGVIKEWHDGTLVYNITGLDFASSKWDYFTTGSNGALGGDTTNHWYLDNFEIYSDTGTGTVTGSMINGDIQFTGGGGGTPPLSWSPAINLRTP